MAERRDKEQTKTARKSARRRVALEPLEPRILLSADPTLGMLDIDIEEQPTEFVESSVVADGRAAVGAGGATAAADGSRVRHGDVIEEIAAEQRGVVGPRARQHKDCDKKEWR